MFKMITEGNFANFEKEINGLESQGWNRVGDPFNFLSFLAQGMEKEDEEEYEEPELAGITTDQVIEYFAELKKTIPELENAGITYICNDPHQDVIGVKVDKKFESKLGMENMFDNLKNIFPDNDLFIFGEGCRFHFMRKDGPNELAWGEPSIWKKGSGWAILEEEESTNKKRIEAGLDPVPTEETVNNMSREDMEKLADGTLLEGEGIYGNNWAIEWDKFAKLGVERITESASSKIINVYMTKSFDYDKNVMQLQIELLKQWPEGALKIHDHPSQNGKLDQECKELVEKARDHVKKLTEGDISGPDSIGSIGVVTVDRIRYDETSISQSHKWIFVCSGCGENVKAGEYLYFNGLLGWKKSLPYHSAECFNKFYKT